MNKSEWKKVYSETRKEIRETVLERLSNSISQDHYLESMDLIREKNPVAYNTIVRRTRHTWKVKNMIERKLSLREIKIAMWANTRVGAMSYADLEWP